jgi:hypothetical protein
VKISLQSGLSYESVHETTKIFKTSSIVYCVHELKEPDEEKLLHYCRWFTHCIRGSIDILDIKFSIVMKHGST